MERITCKRLTKQKVSEVAFQKFNDLTTGVFPVPVDTILESKFGISIIPIPGLKASLRQYSEEEAFLNRGCTEIYIDEDMYMDQFVNRWRFTLAHELAHVILHKSVFGKIKNQNDFITLYSEKNNIEALSWIETQADWFASFFLMPTAEMKKILGEVYSLNEPEDVVGERVKNKLIAHFGVSAQSAKKRVENYLRDNF